MVLMPPRLRVIPKTTSPPSDPTAGYWNFAAGAIILMYVIYITAKGELPSYIKLFFYTPPGAPPTSNPTKATQTGAPVTGQDGKVFQNPGGTATQDKGFFGNITGALSGGIGKLFNGILGINPAM
jgi:hypothetical protein